MNQFMYGSVMLDPTAENYSDCCMGMYTLWLCIDVYADSISDLHLLHTHNYM